jgi:hypothetical protein
MLITDVAVPISRLVRLMLCVRPPTCLLRFPKTVQAECIDQTKEDLAGSYLLAVRSLRLTVVKFRTYERLSCCSVRVRVRWCVCVCVCVLASPWWATWVMETSI